MRCDGVEVQRLLGRAQPANGAQYLVAVLVPLHQGRAQRRKEFLGAPRITPFESHPLNPQLLRGNSSLTLSDVQFGLGEMRPFLI